MCVCVCVHCALYRQVGNIKWAAIKFNVIPFFFLMTLKHFESSRIGSKSMCVIEIVYRAQNDDDVVN